MSMSQTDRRRDRQTDKHIKSIVRNLTKKIICVFLNLPHFYTPVRVVDFFLNFPWLNLIFFLILIRNPNEGSRFDSSDLQKIRTIITQQDRAGILPITVIDSNNASLDDYKITNAAYFLKEHMIILAHVESVEKVFIRLIGQNFSVKKMELPFNSCNG